MAANPTDILSVADAREQLRVGADADSLIATAIEQAVYYVATLTGLPLLDVQEDVYARIPVTEKSAAFLPVLDVMAVRTFQYWQNSQHLRESPNGSFDLSDDTAENYAVLRLDDPGLDYTPLWRSNADWPSFLPLSKVKVGVTRGIDLAGVHRPIKQAVILMMRQFFESPERFESSFAVNALLEPLKRRNYG